MEGCLRTPAEELSRVVVEKLVAEHFITEEDAGKLIVKMATGKIRTEDWKLAVEKSAKGKGK